MTIRLSAKLILRAAITAGLVLPGGLRAEAVDAPIYKCAQENGAVLYADYPCKGGAIVDVRPGLPDPAAVERLERVRAELDRSAARRKANEESAALRREEMARLRFEADAAQNAAGPMIAYPDVTYGPVYGSYGFHGKGRLNRPNLHRRFDAHRWGPDATSKPWLQHRSRVPAVIRRPQSPG
jgi:hypothetical protein